MTEMVPKESFDKVVALYREASADHRRMIEEASKWRMRFFGSIFGVALTVVVKLIGLSK